jgi:glycosyltransferase involved in cell wall biosynthesis
VSTWLDYLLPGLAENGWRPVLGLVSGRFHHVKRYLELHPWDQSVSVTNPTGSREGRIRSLMRLIRRVQPQLAVSVNIPDTYAAIERIRARGNQTPRVVMTNHSVESHYFEDARTWRHVLDGIVCTNRLGVRLACEYVGIDAGRAHYAPYGVELPPELASRHQRTTGPLRIVYAARLDEFQKRAHDIPPILDALERLGLDYELEIAGSGPYEIQLREQLRSRVSDRKVRFLGVISQQGLRRVYDQADVLLVTSFWETGPIVIWEAMAAGLPVVTSRYLGSGLEASLRDGENCLMFPVGDTELAARQLQRAADPRLRATLAEQGYRLVEERYTRDRSIELWDHCLRSILQSPRCESGVKRTSSEPAGRLDRWLGVGRGEIIRRIARRSYPHAEPGGEWPHSYGPQDLADTIYWELVSRRDTDCGSQISRFEDRQI